jgi:hypothetical protein
MDRIKDPKQNQLLVNSLVTGRNQETIYTRFLLSSSIQRMEFIGI